MSTTTTPDIQQQIWKLYYSQVQPIKELICWILNFDFKVYPCFNYFLKKNKNLGYKYVVLNELIDDKFRELKLESLLDLRTNLSDKNIKCTLQSFPKKIEDKKFFKIVTEKGKKVIEGKQYIQVNSGIKELLNLTNKKLKLLITITNQIPYNLTECSLIGQTSTGQILLILKELINNGMQEEYKLQQNIADQLNNMIRLPEKSNIFKNIFSPNPKREVSKQTDKNWFMSPIKNLFMSDNGRRIYTKPKKFKKSKSKLKLKLKSKSKSKLKSKSILKLKSNLKLKSKSK